LWVHADPSGKPRVSLGISPEGARFLGGPKLCKYRLDISGEKVERQAGNIQVFLRNRYNVDPPGDHGTMEPEKFPQEPFHAVAVRGVAGLLAHSQPQPPVRRRGWLIEHEKDEALGMEAPSPLVTVEELLAPNQAKGPRKS